MMPDNQEFNVYELMAALRYEGVSEAAYSIGEPFREGTHCLERAGTRWNVFEMDTGGRVASSVHTSERDACLSLLERVLGNRAILEERSKDSPLTGSVRIDWVNAARRTEAPNLGWRLRIWRGLEDAQLISLLRDVADSVSEDAPGWMGTPQTAVLYSTPGGWRFAIYTTTGVMDGRLSELPADATPNEAKLRFREKVREEQGRSVEIDWIQDPERPEWWVGSYDRASGEV